MHNGEPIPSESILNANNNDEACAYIFGDSFSYSDEVLDNETWGEILGKKMKCQIYNYGVGGYGSDQALLKLQRILHNSKNDHNKSKTIFFWCLSRDVEEKLISIMAILLLFR